MWLADGQNCHHLYYISQMSEKPQNMKETYHGFHSEREQTTHSLEAKPTRNKHFPDDNHELQLQFPIYFTVRTLLLEFRSALKSSGYKCIEMADRQLIIVRFTFADRVKKLFLCRQPPKFLISITTHEFLSVRTVSVKPLKSNSTFAQAMSLTELSSEVDLIGELLLALPSLSNANTHGLNELDTQYKQDFFSLDATSYYMYSRMLVDGNYSLGQKILSILSKFKDEEKIDSCSKDDLHWLHEALSEISDDLLQGFNCSRKELLEILLYCRKSVEQYFHNIHHQHQANQGKMPDYDSENYVEEIRQLTRIVPETLHQFLQLERAKTSMDILKTFFVIGLIFKAEIEIKNIDEQGVTRAVHLIRSAFSGTVSEKSRLLKCFGYQEEQYEHYIGKFSFDHEVTF